MGKGGSGRDVGNCIDGSMGNRLVADRVIRRELKICIRESLETRLLAAGVRHLGLGT